MAHSQSKMTTVYKRDKLVLCIKENDSDTNSIDTTCYVLYDEDEREFMITGNRDNYGLAWGDSYKFYCKKIKHVVNFINTMIDMKNMTTIILYNYNDLYIKHNSLIDVCFRDLDKSTTKKEMTGYNNLTFEDESVVRYMKNLIKSLKYVRY
jgi:hypothetical protein